MSATAKWSLAECRERAPICDDPKSLCETEAHDDRRHLLALVDRMAGRIQHMSLCDAINRHLDVPKRVCDCGLDALLAELDAGGPRNA